MPCRLWPSPWVNSWQGGLPRDLRGGPLLAHRRQRGALAHRSAAGEETWTKAMTKLEQRVNVRASSSCPPAA
eukprot:15436775-Alexandrium_andersonii.AAC.1